MIGTTLDELIAELEDARETLGGDVEVRVAQQPNWPLRAKIDSVTLPPADGLDPFAEDGEPAPIRDDERVVWIATHETGDDPTPYAPRWAWGE